MGNYTQILKPVAITSVMLSIAYMLIGVPATAFAASATEVYRAVKISDQFLQGVRGNITVKSITTNNDHRDYFVYANFDGEGSSIGSGYYVAYSGGIATYYNLVYYKIAGGFVNHDLWTTIPINTSFLADVRQTTNGSNCYKATTYNGNNRTFCLAPSTTSATIAGAIARAQVSYSSSNHLSGLFDYLGTYHYNGGYVSKYFTDAITNESKCQSIGGYVEDDLLKRAPSGSANDKFDKIGFGPTLYTADDCISNSSVWSAFGST